MNQLIMWEYYFLHLFHNSLNLSILIVSLALSVVFYFLFKRTKEVKKRTKFLYAHIALLFFPFLFAAIFWFCGMTFSECAPMVTALFLPITLTFLFLLNIIFLPYIYNWSSNHREISEGFIQNFVEKTCEESNLKVPKVYYINDLRPIAYSFSNRNPSIFISVGLSEILTKDEMKAVLLHELYHIKNKSSLWKFSLTSLKSFSPLAAFATVEDSFDLEENEADNFASKIQGTNKFLTSAKMKMNRFNS